MRERPTVERCVIEAAQRGDSAAFAEIYTTFHRYVLGVAANCLRKAPRSVQSEHRRGVDMAAVEDIVQETFFNAFRRMDRVDADRPLAPWLCTIALNLCRNSIKRSPKGLRSIDVGNQDQQFDLRDQRSTCDPQKTMEGKQILERVERAMEGLSARRRKFFELRVFEGLSREEIAVALNVSRNVAGNEVRRATMQVREALRTDGVERV